MKLTPYATKVLDPIVHARLVADIESVAQDAGIQPSWIWTPMSKNCTDDEVQWVRRFRHHTAEGSAGLAFVGRDLEPENRMAAIAGALTRNFINAKVMTLGQVVDYAKDSVLPGVSCLLIPNFFIEKSHGGGIASWQVSLLLDVLVDRQAKGLQTVIYVSDLSALGAEYGKALLRHVENNFVCLEES